MKTYVKNSTGVLKRVLMCSTDYYKLLPLNFVAKQWADKGVVLDPAKCKAQHDALIAAYQANGVEVELIKPKEGLTYQVFARDFGVCIAEGYIMGAFREPVRRGETAEYEQKMAELGVPCVARCTAGAFEGGDFFFLDDYTMLHGVIERTDWDGLNNIKEQVNYLGYELIGVPVDKKYLHLDVCLNIIAEKTAVICKDILPSSVVRRFEKRGYALIEITPQEVLDYAANIQCLGDGRVLSSTTNIRINGVMRSLGLTVTEVDISEIVKGGGGIHCMTFPLERV